jgi:multiple sugar transport system substrate-binding protein
MRSYAWGAGVLAALMAAALLAALPVAAPAPAETKVLHYVTFRPDHPRVWKELIARFERQHGVRVVREIGPHSSTDFHAMLTQKLKNRDPSVDVFNMDVIWPPEFAAAGWAEPLGGYLPEAERSAFFKAALTANSWQGRLYGIPGWIDAGILYYRKDLLDHHGFAPPRTWGELVRQAETIRAAETEPGLWGYSAQLRQYEGLVCNMLEFVESGGVPLIDDNGHPQLSSPQAVAAVAFVRDRIIGRTAPRGVLTYQEPESLALFVEGKAVFMRNWPYAWGIASDPARSRVAGKVGMAPLPHFPGGQSVATLGGWQWGISPFSRNKELAWEFVRYMTSEETQRFLAVRAGKAPSRHALYGDAEVLRAQPHFREQYTSFRHARPRPCSPLYPAISSVLQSYFSRSIVSRGSRVPALAREAEARIARLQRLMETSPPETGPGAQRPQGAAR